MQVFQATDSLNKRMRLSAWVRSEGIESWAGLRMRVDGQQHGSLSFDNMQNRPIKGTTDWHRYEVVLDVPAESVAIAFGLLLTSPAKGWPG